MNQRRPLKSNLIPHGLAVFCLQPDSGQPDAPFNFAPGSRLVHPAVCQSHLFGTATLNVHRLRYNQKAQPPRFVAFHSESDIVKHLQDAEAIGCPKISMIISKGRAPIVPRGGNIRTEVILRVSFYEKSAAAALT